MKGYEALEQLALGQRITDSQGREHRVGSSGKLEVLRESPWSGDGPTWHDASTVDLMLDGWGLLDEQLTYEQLAEHLDTLANQALDEAGSSLLSAMDARGLQVRGATLAYAAKCVRARRVLPCPPCGDCCYFGV